MKRRTWTALSGVTAAAVAVTLSQAPAQAVPQQQHDQHPQSSTHRSDDLKSPITEQARDLRQAAVEKLIKGKAKLKTINGTRVIEVKSDPANAKGKVKSMKARPSKKSKYVQYDVDREENIFTILTDFGTKTDPRTGGEAGPAHNNIAKPDRSSDNSTYWEPDFNREHYLNMMFGSNENGESFQDFYLHQSNGRFLAKGDVSDWVTVPYNEARYGSNEIPESDGYWNYIKDTAQAWYDQQKADGKSDAEIKDYLSQFDQWDRYDHDGDGDFNEADGYIDHFQAIHAGEGEEAGGGAQGADAIWSHRWYAFSTNQGKTGPEGNLLGGVPIGDTGLWIGDYTTEPENGGLGVFSHEFGHDLGLPDLYDTAGGENGTGFWTLMSSGSWLGHGKDSIGTTPGYMGAYEKLQLGWLDYTQVNYGYDRRVKLGPADRDARNLGQALLVNLPDKTVTTDYNTPKSGQYEWWGGSADNLNTTLSRTIDLTDATSATLSVAAEYWIEQDYDYLYGEVSTDGGATWAQVGEPTSGNSDGWQNLSYDLSDYAGQSIQFRFRYATDGGLHYQGPFLDDFSLSVDGAEQWTDDVESGVNGWVADGFTRMIGSTTKKVQHYYLAEHRVYAGYDKTLKQGPYNFVGGDTPNWVEHFPYQNGLLVTYVDGEYTDNNTSTHPGHGLVLPVDAHSQAMFWKGGDVYDGQLVSNRIQPFDATFGKQRTNRLNLHKSGAHVRLGKQRGVRTFDDTNPYRYWSAANPQNSVQTAGSGTVITVRNEQKNNVTLKVHFRNQGGTAKKK